MTAPELKPCPFCGGEALISKDHDQDGNGAFYAVKCRKCRAKSPEIYAVETCNIHFAQVRDAWNRRADLAAVQPAPVRVKWDKIETAPRGGEWFIARTEHGTTRVVHFADEYDRFPISHDGVVWSIAPIEWTPLRPVLSALEPLPDQTVEIDLRVAMMEELEKAASESPWVPEEYYMNEVISDCCAFLRSNRSQPDPRDEVTDAARDVLAERQRQINAEGWTQGHDDRHAPGELAGAAACYAMQAALDSIGDRRLGDTVKAAIGELWPWSAQWWKPSTNRRDMVKAGALILAEIERLDRAALAAAKAVQHG